MALSLAQNFARKVLPADEDVLNVQICESFFGVNILSKDSELNLTKHLHAPFPNLIHYAGCDEPDP